MNKFFEDTSELRFEPPARAFARFDQSEPIDLTEAEEALVAFEAVDAQWLLDWWGFDGGQESGKLRDRWAAYWQQIDGRRRLPADDLFSDMPIYRFEMTVRRGEQIFHEVEKYQEDPRWMLFTRSPDAQQKIDVYGGLFTAPIAAPYKVEYAPGKYERALNIVFDMDTWPDAGSKDIHDALQPSASADYLAMYDIGQGSANALLDTGRLPRLYFDLGCGVYRNAHTAPTPLRYCWSQQPAIVLSHWDADHWAGANKDQAALRHTWLAPRQSIGPVHAGFANRILQSGGRIMIWGPGSGQSVALHAGQRSVELSRCLGSGRNGSGIAMYVDDSHTDRSWLLTGDAGYHEISMALRLNLAAVVVPHHGAMMHPHSQPPLPNAGYRRLLYSFGPDNKHGATNVQHPTANAVALHAAAGWRHGTWPTHPPPGITQANGDVLATAKHPGQHLGGAIVGWAVAPNPSATACGAVFGAPQNCSISLDQS